MRIYILFLAFLSTLIGSRSSADIVRQVITGGLNFPVYAAAPPEDNTRLFIIERRGVIRIFDLRSNFLLPVPFLDISDRVETQGEGGLYSIAFHPQFSSNGLFFIFYTTDISQDDEFTLGIRVSRFHVSADPNIADASSEVAFLDLRNPTDIHNGGMIAFRPNDPNNYLYIAVGDGGGACDPDARAQEKNDKRGKILRIDVDAGPSNDLENPYVPATNPYVDAPGDDAVWVIGLRNPYRFSFDRVTGDMYIGDVGQGSREEIDFVSAASLGGENFGWDALEGSIVPPNCFLGPNPELDMVVPIHEYDHNGKGAAVVGGYVYRGAAYPEFTGRYFFADFVTGRVWSCLPTAESVTDLQDHTAILNPHRSRITGFGEDSDGDLYILELQGKISRIISQPPPPPDIDQDLLPDDYEDDTGVFVSPTQTGTDPLDFDTDDDGIWDGIEVFLGTDPNDPFDVPSLSVRWIWGLGVVVTLLAAGAIYLTRRRTV